MAAGGRHVSLTRFVAPSRVLRIPHPLPPSPYPPSNQSHSRKPQPSGLASSPPSPAFPSLLLLPPHGASSQAAALWGGGGGGGPTYLPGQLPFPVITTTVQWVLFYAAVPCRHAHIYVFSSVGTDGPRAVFCWRTPCLPATTTTCCLPPYHTKHPSTHSAYHSIIVYFCSSCNTFLALLCCGTFYELVV